MARAPARSREHAGRGCLRRAVGVSGVTLSGAVPQSLARLRHSVLSCDKGPVGSRGGNPFVARSRRTAARLVRLAANLPGTARPRRFCRKVDSSCGRGFSGVASSFGVATQESELPRRRFLCRKMKRSCDKMNPGCDIVATSCGTAFSLAAQETEMPQDKKKMPQRQKICRNLL